MQHLFDDDYDGDKKGLSSSLDINHRRENDQSSDSMERRNGEGNEGKGRAAGGRRTPPSKEKLEKRRNDSTREESDAFSLGCDRFRVQDDGPGRAA